MKPLHRLAEQAGIQTEWHDAAGRRQETGDDALRKVLAALGCPAETEKEIELSLGRLKEEANTIEFVTGDCGEPIRLPPGSPGAAELELEDGSIRTVMLVRGARHLFLPPVEQPGYHRLHVGRRTIRVAVSPPRCFSIEEVTGDRRVWGAAVQVPSLRHDAASAFGDFASVGDAGRQFAARGADALAISPVHALFPADPSRFSPYGPSSRAFLNVLFADPTLLGQPVRPLDGGELIDWKNAIPNRVAGLRHAFEAARDTLSNHLAEYRAQAGSALVKHATFDAIYAHFSGTGARGWQDWPRAFHDHGSEEVARFAAEHAGEVDFYVFAQWLAARSLEAAQRAAIDGGMSIGLISDLAVGLDSGGSEVWSRPGELLEGLSIGAPPDPLGPHGQDWGLTTFTPAALQARGFEPLIATLRANLSLCGGIRIDHALGLNRLWVIPHDSGSADGAYLRYPFEDMLRIVALESHRASAVVIGEDLGTVPVGLRRQLEERAILGMRVLWFERENGGFIPPEQWQRDAVAMTGTHDLFTVAGWWSERDVDWAWQLARGSPSSSETADRQERRRERHELWSAFTASGAAEGPPSAPDSTARVVDAATAHVASAPAHLALFPLEDIVGLREQPNLPGTTSEHPNWRRRMPGTTGEMLDADDVVRRIEGINRKRQQ